MVDVDDPGGSGTVRACFRWTIGALFGRSKREKPGGFYIATQAENFLRAGSPEGIAKDTAGLLNLVCREFTDTNRIFRPPVAIMRWIKRR
jgi:hypothetical protein